MDSGCDYGVFGMVQFMVRFRVYMLRYGSASFITVLLVVITTESGDSGACLFHYSLRFTSSWFAMVHYGSLQLKVIFGSVCYDYNDTDSDERLWQ